MPSWGDLWKGFEHVETVISFVGAVFSVLVWLRLGRMRSVVLLRSALADHKKRMGGIQRTLSEAVKGKRSILDSYPALTAQVADLKSKLDGVPKNSPALAPLRNSLAALSVRLQGATADEAPQVLWALSEVLEHMQSVERDNSWSVD